MSEEEDEGLYTGAIKSHLEFLDKFDKICPQGAGKTYHEMKLSDDDNDDLMLSPDDDLHDTISSPDPPPPPPQVFQAVETHTANEGSAPALRTRSRRNRNPLEVLSTIDLTDSPEPVVRGRTRRGTRRGARNIGPVTCTVDLTDSSSLNPRGGAGGRRNRRRGRPARQSRGGSQQQQQQPVASIDLSDLEENKNNFNSNNSFSDQVNVNDEDVNYEMVIRVWWKMRNCDRFIIRKYQKFTSIFDHYSKQENVPHDDIYLALKDSRVIRPDDTPDSLGLLMTTFVDGGVMKNKITLPSSHTETKADANMIELKVQHKGAKVPMRLQIRNTDTMLVLMIKCAESLEVPVEKLKFYFDGQVIKKDETPEDLELEGGECIDLHML